MPTKTIPSAQTNSKRLHHLPCQDSLNNGKVEFKEFIAYYKKKYFLDKTIEERKARMAEKEAKKAKKAKK